MTLADLALLIGAVVAYPTVAWLLHRWARNEDYPNNKILGVGERAGAGSPVDSRSEVAGARGGEKLGCSGPPAASAAVVKAVPRATDDSMEVDRG